MKKNKKFFRNRGFIVKNINLIFIVKKTTFLINYVKI